MYYLFMTSFPFCDLSSGLPQNFDSPYLGKGWSQSVKNSIGRHTLNNKQRLAQFHWLPEDITYFKIALVTYKSIVTSQPSYLHSLINRYHPTRTLRPSNQEMVVVPSLTTNFGRRSFSYASAKNLEQSSTRTQTLFHCCF